MTKKCYYSISSKFILFHFHSSGSSTTSSIFKKEIQVTSSKRNSAITIEEENKSEDTNVSNVPINKINAEIHWSSPDVTEESSATIVNRDTVIEVPIHQISPKDSNETSESCDNNTDANERSSSPFVNRILPQIPKTSPKDSDENSTLSTESSDSFTVATSVNGVTNIEVPIPIATSTLKYTNQNPTSATSPKSVREMAKALDERISPSLAKKSLSRRSLSQTDMKGSSGPKFTSGEIILIKQPANSPNTFIDKPSEFTTFKEPKPSGYFQKRNDPYFQVGSASKTETKGEINKGFLPDNNGDYKEAFQDGSNQITETTVLGL